MGEPYSYARPCLRCERTDLAEGEECSFCGYNRVTEEELDRLMDIAWEPEARATTSESPVVAAPPAGQEREPT